MKVVKVEEDKDHTIVTTRSFFFFKQYWVAKTEDIGLGSGTNIWYYAKHGLVSRANPVISAYLTWEVEKHRTKVGEKAEVTPRIFPCRGSTDDPI
jgi:hypothetical protein